MESTKYVIATQEQVSATNLIRRSFPIDRSGCRDRIIGLPQPGRVSDCVSSLAVAKRAFAHESHLRGGRAKLGAAIRRTVPLRRRNASQLKLWRHGKAVPSRNLVKR